MTHIKHTRDAVIRIDDSSVRLTLSAEYDPSGELESLMIEHGHLASICVHGLAGVEDLVDAILTVVPAAAPDDMEADEGDDSPDADDRIECAEALRDEAMILSAAAGHLMQARAKSRGAA